MKIRFMIYAVFLSLALLSSVSAQDSEDNGVQISTPDVSAVMSLGFNYDYLRSPLRVDYDRARGMFGINIPLKFQPNAEVTGSLMSGISDNFTDGEYFAPEVAVKQFANTTLQVDVPFLGGVLQWSHMRMVNIRYENEISLQDFVYAPDTIPGAGDMEGIDSLGMLMKGSMAVPLGFDIGWETMTFGYSYRFNETFAAALNMTRHYFHFSLEGNVDIDLLGKLDVMAEIEDVTLNEEINPDYSLHNQVNGFYDMKRWTPTIAMSAWRFQFIGRFGFKSKAEGSLYGGYSVPFFIDAENFTPDSIDADYIMDNLSKFKNSETDSVAYSTTNDLTWEMPSGFTLGFDIVPEKLNISYTKFARQIYMKLEDSDFQKNGDDAEQEFDTLSLEFGAKVDHIVLLQGYFSWMYFKTGIFSFDVMLNGKENVVGGIEAMVPYGEGVMLPILSGGVLLGDKMQFKGEIDLFPFPAFNTGIIYHF